MKAFIFSSIFICFLTLWIDIANAEEAIISEPQSAGVAKLEEKNLLQLTLQDCIDIAMQHSRRRTVSQESVKIAQAQLGQALSGYWPQLKFGMTALRMDEDPNFIFPAQSIPLNNLNSFSVPAQNVKLMDRDLLSSNLSLIFPIYTGGKISAATKQAKIGVEVSKEDSRQTDLQIVRDIRQYYYGHIFAKKLLLLGQETLDRFEATLELTESVYQHGSGRAKKTDYLRTKVVTNALRSALEMLKSNVELSRSALVNVMGLSWNTRIELASSDIPFQPYSGVLEEFVEKANQNNPQMAQDRLGLKAREEKITEAKAGHLPVVVFLGGINHLDNSYNGGLMTDANRNSWEIGLALELPIFNGFRTSQEVQEARHRLEKLKQESLLLQEGVALQVKHAFLQIARSQNQVKASQEALASAAENRELNIRAYKQEMVETKDVIEAQLLEFFIHGQLLQALYDHQINSGNLEFIIGSTIYETR